MFKKYILSVAMAILVMNVGLVNADYSSGARIGDKVAYSDSTANQVLAVIPETTADKVAYDTSQSTSALLMASKNLRTPIIAVLDSSGTLYIVTFSSSALIKTNWQTTDKDNPIGTHTAYNNTGILFSSGTLTHKTIV